MANSNVRRYQQEIEKLEAEIEEYKNQIEALRNSNNEDKDKYALDMEDLLNQLNVFKQNKELINQLNVFSQKMKILVTTTS